MKKIFIALLLAAFSLGASAQFEKGTKYVGASVSNFGLSYNKYEDFRLGLHALGGYFVADNWLLLGQLGWDHYNGENSFDVGASARYYFKKTGIFCGAGLKFGHVGPDIVKNNLYLTPEVGYCFYLNQNVSIEPAIYCDWSLNHGRDFTKIGLRVGFGYYF